MKLYEIDQEIQKILDNMSVDEDTGEVILDTEALNALQEARQDKLENAALYVKDLEAMASAIRDEEKKLTERRKAIENKAGRIRDWIADNLNGEKISTPRVALSVRVGQPSVKIDDMSAIQEWYFERCVTPSRDGMSPESLAERDRITNVLDLRFPEPTVSKAGLKKLMADYEIPGAHVEVGQPSLQIK